jgi:hypothetical protein
MARKGIKDNFIPSWGIIKRDPLGRQAELKMAEGEPASPRQVPKASGIAQTSSSGEGEDHEKYSPLVSRESRQELI